MNAGRDPDAQDDGARRRSLAGAAGACRSLMAIEHCEVQLFPCADFEDDTLSWDLDEDDADDLVEADTLSCDEDTPAGTPYSTTMPCFLFF